MDDNRTWYDVYPELLEYKDRPVEELPRIIRRIEQDRRTKRFLDRQRERRGKPRPSSRRAHRSEGDEDGTSRESS